MNHIPFVRHDLFMYVADRDARSLAVLSDPHASCESCLMTHAPWLITVCVPRRIHMCDMTHSYIADRDSKGLSALLDPHASRDSWNVTYATHHAPWLPVYRDALIRRRQGFYPVSCDAWGSGMWFIWTRRGTQAVSASVSWHFLFENR